MNSFRNVRHFDQHEGRPVKLFMAPIIKWWLMLVRSTKLVNPSHPGKMAAPLQSKFAIENCLLSTLLSLKYVDWDFDWGVDWWDVINSLSNGLAPIRRQANIYSNGDPIEGRIYATLGKISWPIINVHSQDISWIFTDVLLMVVFL